MALSKSFQEGQVPMSCQLCEECSEIKWKCLQCDFLLCTKCQKLHKKVKSTNQHTIIDIKDIALHQKKTKDKLERSNIPCGIHAGQICCLFCKSCKEVVCSLCITQNHNKHNMTEFSEGYCLMVDTMKTVNLEIPKKLVQNEKVLSELGFLKISEGANYELQTQKILYRENVLKDELENTTKKLLKELDQRREVVMKSVNDAENVSQKIIKHLELRKKNLSQVLNSNDVSQVFGICSKDETLRQTGLNLENTAFTTWPQFVQGKEVVEDFYLGALIEPDNDQRESIFRVIKQYKTDQKLVENIVCSSNGEMWISDFCSHNLHKMKLTNELLSQLDTFKIDVYNMAVLPLGDLLISTMESNLKILSNRTSKVKTTKYRVKPLITLAVHVTSDQKILIGARENQPNSFPVNGPRQVIMTNMDGKIEKVYHTDNKGKLMFTVPYRITTDNDNNIYVIDVLDEKDNGRIVAINKTEVRWIYSGYPDINRAQKFKPKDLVATKCNNIIVTDDDNHIIHILNTSGECIHYINTKTQFGIQLPYSLDIDNKGTLFIGCTKYERQPNEAKVYAIQISGF